MTTIAHLGPKTNINKHLSLVLLVLGIGFLVACASPQGSPSQTQASRTVMAQAETEAALHDPDDPAIWVPENRDPQGVRILATDKGYGLLVYDLKGTMVQQIPSGRLNNVDLRGNLAFASNRTDTSLSWYRIDGQGRVTEGATRHPLISLVGANPEIYGLCAYQSAKTGQLYVFANFKNGLIVQMAVVDTGTTLNFTEVRRLKVASQPEGMVADDQLGLLYVGEEDKGIWRFGAEPSDPSTATLVDSVGSPQLGYDDVEGLAIYTTGPNTGYLVASSQGTHSYALYDRQGNNQARGSFRIVSSDTIDNVSETDGLEVTSVQLGPQFPQGFLVVQDDKNEGFTKNFKIVSWKDLNLP